MTDRQMKVPKEFRIERERRVWELRQKMWTQEQIAKETGITQSGVAKLLKRITARYAASFSDDVGRIKTEQVAQLEHIASEAMQAWERSKEPGKTVWIKRPMGSDGKPLPGEGEQTNEARDQDGDPRYLSAAMKAKEDIRKIVGAEAPQKLQHSGDKDGDPIKLDIQAAKGRLMDKLARLASRGREEGDT